MKVQFLGACTKGMSWLLVTEYMDGGNLSSLLSKENYIIDWKIAKQFASDILKGLIYLHDKKLIHRDLKPENILITYERGMRAKIAGMLCIFFAHVISYSFFFFFFFFFSLGGTFRLWHHKDLWG